MFRWNADIVWLKWEMKWKNLYKRLIEMVKNDEMIKN